MNEKFKILTALIIVLLASVAMSDESFGRNKVQYEYLDWKYFDTPTFRIYFADGYEELARLGGEILEDAYYDVSSDLGHDVIEPVPVVIYPSPGEFQETNIVMSILGEGTGGFTESFKTRVVLPFNGSYEDYRHVLIHEMAHAVCFDMLLGRGPISILSTNRIFQMPLWMAEGISEWESVCWDVESDMYLRDAILNGYVAPLSELDGFLAYKEGASVIGYLARRYGRKKIGEILGKGKIHITPDKALKAAVGRDQKKLYEDWLNIKKREYFPEFGFRQRPEDVAERLTDHTEDGSYFNVMPAFSPDGHRVAFISNRDDYIDMFVLDVITDRRVRVARGERSGAAESFHPFRSRPGWSSDGHYLAYSRKSAGKDEIAIRNSRDWDLFKTLRFEDIKEISSPVFVPGDTSIVFSGLAWDRADLYIAAFDGDGIRKLTDDKWDDNSPSISPDGRYVAFSSDRPVEGETSRHALEPEQGQITSEAVREPKEFPYGNYNVWILDIEADTIAPLTRDGFGNGQPEWSPNGESIVYTSERNGIRNIWIAELGDSIVHRPYTDLLSGAFSPTYDPDGDKLVFSAFYDGGFDLYYMNSLSPLDSLVTTPYMLARDTICPPETDTSGSAEPFVSIDGDLRRYNFPVDTGGTETEDDFSPEAKPYTPQFSVDLVAGSVGYDTYYGFRGMTYLMFSDVFGNHRVLFITDLFEDIENSTVFAYYTYLARRMNFGIGGYHYKNYFWLIRDNYDEIFSDRVYGGMFYVEYPFSQYNRIELSAEGFVVDRDYYEIPPSSGLESVSPFNLRLELAAVRDNSLWKYTGPLAGTRAKVALEYVPPLGENSMDYGGARFDWRRYWHFGDGYGIALRATAGGVWGKRTPEFWLGGSQDWLNWRLVDKDIYSVDNLYFSRMIMPLRGYPYFAYSGQYYALCNFELRYPFVQQLELGFPPISIHGINGAMFMDVGTIAGKDIEKYRAWKGGHLNDIKMSVGVGARSWIWMFLFYYDLAWSTDLVEISDKPIHHFGLGAEF